jgi:hypothetical protein
VGIRIVGVVEGEFLEVESPVRGARERAGGFFFSRRVSVADFFLCGSLTSAGRVLASAECRECGGSGSALKLTCGDCGGSGSLGRGSVEVWGGRIVE